jgi:tyrosine-protein kinase Etk/Wzc
MPIETAPSPSTPPAGREPARRTSPPRTSPPDTTLREVGATLIEGRWVIAGMTALMLGLALGYLFAARPVYRATALVQIEDPPRDGLERLSPVFEEKTSIDGEIEIMRSRMVISPVVDQLGLDLVAEPSRAPVIGGTLARRHRGEAPAPARLGLERYGWGGERIAVARLEVGEDLLERPLTLVAQAEGRFRLLDPDGERLLDGEVGTPVATAVSGAARAVELLVSALAARPGTEFRIEKRRHDEVVGEIQAGLGVSERGRASGVVAIELDGPDAARAAAVVSSLAALYVRQNVERRSEEAAKKLEFLEAQLPKVKARLEGAESSLNAFRVKNGIVDLPLEARATIDRAAELDREISNVTAEGTTLRQRYGDRHPDLVTAERRLSAIRAERDALDGRIRAFPAAQLTAARLVRDVNVSTDLYTLLLDRAQSLAIAKSGTIGNVRIIDRPVVSRRPVFPKPSAVLLVGLVLGLGAGIAGAFARRALDEGEEHAQDIQAATGLPVLVTVGHSARERELHRRARRGPRAPLAEAAPQDVATEHLRTLRTVLGFILKARGNVVAVSSPTAAAGKTFVCANLAQLLAAAGKRVLLVDADLRRGALHRHFSVDPGPGLSRVISGAATLDAAIVSTKTSGLDLLPRGDIPDSPAELLASPRLEETLAGASRRYDVVIVDTPPSLAVTDPVLVGRCASVNLFVLRAREHPVSEIAAALERFARSGVEVQGAILNDVRPADGRYARVYALTPAERTA